MHRCQTARTMVDTTVHTTAGHIISPPVSRRASKLSAAASRGSSVAMPGAEAPAMDTQDRAPWVNYVLAWTFCVQAVLIGTILSTAPLLLHDALGLGVLHVGFAFAGVHGMPLGLAVRAC